MSLYRNALEAWLKTIRMKADRVIDLGGAANPIIGRLNNAQFNEYVIFDNGIEEPKMEYVKFDINEPLEQLKGYNEDSFKYDCLFCLEVFEYVWNPVEAMRNISRLLCDDGIAYLSFPSIYPVHNPVRIDYLRYTKEAIKKYIELVGLNLLSIIPRVATKGRDVLAEFYAREGMHPVKGSDLPFHIGYMVKVVKPFKELDMKLENRKSYPLYEVKIKIGKEPKWKKSYL